MNRKSSIHPLPLSRKNKGSSMLEFAISAALFIAILIGATIWALNIWRVATLQYAVEQGARCAILPGSSTGKKCVDAKTTANKNAFEMPEISQDNFKQDDKPNTFSDTSGVSVTTECVRTLNAANPFALASGLTRSGPGIGSVAYCRMKQS